MYSYKMLDKISMATLHEAFVDAFSDYQVKMDLPFWKFQQMLQRRGITPKYLWEPLKMREWSDLLSMDFEAGMERQLHMTLVQAL